MLPASQVRWALSFLKEDNRLPAMKSVGEMDSLTLHKQLSFMVYIWLQFIEQVSMLPPPSRVWSQQHQRTLLLIVSVSTLLSFPCATGCCTSIFSFGDSLADTGNLYFSSDPPTHHCFFSPNGQTHFHHPSGRCSDGRLVVDFIAEHLGIPYVKPYVGMKNGRVKESDVREGVNFAVIGATALEVGFFEEKGIWIVPTNDSLKVQLDWFKQLLPSICNSSSSCRKVLGSSLFLVGEIGGNDYNYPFGLRKSIEEIKKYVPHVIHAITSAITELIDAGAGTLIVPGNLPIGCNALYLTVYESRDMEKYDEAGCLKWLNEFAEYHNDMLQAEINRLQALHPDANIIYADYYNAALPLYHYPLQFGFQGLKACCGGGGPYNYNASAVCGRAGVRACDDPSQYIGWDGIHLTEAAYRLIANSLLFELHHVANISTSCFL